MSQRSQVKCSRNAGNAETKRRERKREENEKEKQKKKEKEMEERGGVIN